jgi:alpha-ketoglutarate-dependent 2,4-dichlorophenoxyacetate dioxygenase
MRITPLHSLFAAEINGVDLAADLAADRDDETVAAIRDAFERYSVLVFRDQRLTDEAQLAFSRRLGPLEETKKGSFGSGTQLVTLSNIGADGSIVPPTARQVLIHRANQFWHSDSSFKRVPALASLLSGRVVPPEGADTEFASMRAAWAALPEESKARVEGLVAVHDFGTSRNKIDPTMFTDEEKAQLPPVRQAMVRTNPVTGEKALFIGSHATYVEGMDMAEGQALIAELMAFATQARFAYRHRWRAHDAVLWDNRAVLHRATDYDVSAHPRHMVRTTIAGDGPTVDGTVEVPRAA